ncbi:hypothetical protein FA95DRAFT_1576989, partial [Auriscalpium vulgare]
MAAAFNRVSWALDEDSDGEDEPMSASLEDCLDLVEVVKAGLVADHRIKIAPLDPGRAHPAYVDRRRQQTANMSSEISIQAHLQQDGKGKVSAIKSPYVGRKGPSAGEISLRTVEAGNGSGVKVWDASQRLMVLRAWTPTDSPSIPWINAALMDAAALLEGLPSSFTRNMRGNFKTHWFALHRGSQTAPRHSSYYLEHKDVADLIRERLEGVRDYCERIFRNEAPRLHGRYTETMDWIATNTGCDALFYPFASFAFNIGEVSCRRHVDFFNLGPGWCMIIPFGDFDHRRDCRL